MKLNTPVSAREWQIARQQLADQANGSRLLRQQNTNLAHDFIVIDNQLYALGRVLGKGGYGQVQLAQDEQGTVYVAKTGFGENETENMPFPESLWKRLGLIKGVVAINAYEAEVLLDLAMAVASCQEPNNERQVTIIRYLGIPLKHYLDHHNLSRDEEQALALKVIRAYSTFHRGTNSLSQTRRLHNDIKLANVLINPDSGEVSIIDFGEAFDLPMLSYGEDRYYRHPRATSIEPELIAPEIADQAGPLFAPLTRYGHTRRCYSVKSDTYLLGHIIAAIGKSSPLVKSLASAMFADNPQHRPSLDFMQQSLDSSHPYQAMFAAIILCDGHQTTTSQQWLDKVTASASLKPCLESCYRLIHQANGDAALKKEAQILVRSIATWDDASEALSGRLNDYFAPLNNNYGCCFFAPPTTARQQLAAQLTITVSSTAEVSANSC